MTLPLGTKPNLLSIYEASEDKKLANWVSGKLHSNLVLKIGYEFLWREVRGYWVVQAALNPIKRTLFPPV